MNDLLSSLINLAVNTDQVKEKLKQDSDSDEDESQLEYKINNMYKKVWFPRCEKLDHQLQYLCWTCSHPSFKEQLLYCGICIKEEGLIGNQDVMPLNYIIQKSNDLKEVCIKNSKAKFEKLEYDIQVFEKNLKQQTLQLQKNFINYLQVRKEKYKETIDRFRSLIQERKKIQDESLNQFIDNQQQLNEYFFNITRESVKDYKQNVQMALQHLHFEQDFQEQADFINIGKELESIQQNYIHQYDDFNKYIINNANFLSLNHSINDDLMIDLDTKNMCYQTQNVTIQQHKGAIFSVDQSKFVKYIASAGEDQLINIYDKNDFSFQDLNCQKIYTQFMEHKSVVTHLCFYNNDESKLASCSGDHLIKIWNLNDLKCIQTLQGHTDGISCISIDQYDSLLISGSYDGLIKIWDLNNFELIMSFNQLLQVSFVKFSPYNQIFASMTINGQIKTWNYETQSILNRWLGQSQGFKAQPLQVYKSIIGKDINSNALAFSVDQVTMAIAGPLNCITFVKLSDINQMNTVFKNAHVSNTTCVNFSPNKPNIIISGDMEGIIKIWNMENHKCLQLLDGHKGSIRQISFNGEQIVSCSLDGTVKIWNVKIT